MRTKESLWGFFASDPQLALVDPQVAGLCAVFEAVHCPRNDATSNRAHRSNA